MPRPFDYAQGRLFAFFVKGGNHTVGANDGSSRAISKRNLSRTLTPSNRSCEEAFAGNTST